MPLTASWIPSRLAKVVLPDDVGAGDRHQADPWPMGENFVGHLRDLFFVQPFGDTNDVVDLIVEAELVELPHILHAEHFLPAAGLDIGRKKQRPGGESG